MNLSEDDDLKLEACRGFARMMNTLDLSHLACLKFLDYNPIPQPEDLLEKRAWYKPVNGLSLEQLGVEMGDPE